MAIIPILSLIIIYFSLRVLYVWYRKVRVELVLKKHKQKVLQEVSLLTQQKSDYNHEISQSKSLLESIRNQVKVAQNNLDNSILNDSGPEHKQTKLQLIELQQDKSKLIQDIESLKIDKAQLLNEKKRLDQDLSLKDNIEQELVVLKKQEQEISSIINELTKTKDDLSLTIKTERQKHEESLQKESLLKKQSIDLLNKQLQDLNKQKQDLEVFLFRENERVESEKLKISEQLRKLEEQQKLTSEKYDSELVALNDVLKQRQTLETQLQEKTKLSEEVELLKKQESEISTVIEELTETKDALDEGFEAKEKDYQSKLSELHQQLMLKKKEVDEEINLKREQALNDIEQWVKNESIRLTQKLEEEYQQQLNDIQEELDRG